MRLTFLTLGDLVSAETIGLALLSPEEVRTLGEHRPARLTGGEDVFVAQALTVSGSPAILSAARVFLEHIAREGQQTTSVLSALARDPERGLITTVTIGTDSPAGRGAERVLGRGPQGYERDDRGLGGSSAKNASFMACR